MDNDNKTQKDRASLRGKGRKILLGDQADQSAEQPERDVDETKSGSPQDASRPVDPSALSLSPDETDALLDFSTDEPPFDPALEFPDPDTFMPERPAAAADQPSATGPDVAEPARVEPFALPEQAQADYPEPGWDELDWMETDEQHDVPPDELDAADSFDFDTAPPAWREDYPEHPAQAQQAAPDTPGEPRIVPQPPHHGDAFPLGERPSDDVATIAERAYVPAAAIESLVPSTPEEWDEHDGGSLRADAAELEVPAEQTAPPLVHDPFAPTPDRPSSKELFERTEEPDRELLHMLVGDNRIQRLADLIEELQEELATDFYADRVTVDTYQNELLRANGLLLESRENYDDARAIVYRIRADMNRQRKIDADIKRYRPLLLNYYIGWVIALGVLFLLKALITGVTDAVGIETAAALYYPMLLGAGGALLSGVLTLERHTTRLRDFDPIHISWYLSNPLLGGAMGLLMFLIASIANEDLLRETASDAEYAITYLLCVVAGMNQNSVLRRLNDLLERFGRGHDDDDRRSA